MTTLDRTPRAVFVDLGGCLIVPDPPVAQQYHTQAHNLANQYDLKAADLPSKKAIGRRFNTFFQHDGCSGEQLRYGTTHAEGKWFWLRVLRTCFPQRTSQFTYCLTQYLYDHFKLSTAWGILDGVQHCLRMLNERDIPLVLISNWDLRARELLSNLDLLQYVDQIFISAEQGVEKPDGTIFRRALDSVSATPDQAVMIGDELNDDISPALQSGMKGVLLKLNGPDEHTYDENYFVKQSWKGIQATLFE